MAFPVPVNLSPSWVEAFTSCPLAFRFASIEKLPEPPRPHTTKGSLVHRALELLFADHPPSQRTPAAGVAALARATSEYEAELAALGLEAADGAALRADTVRLVERYFEMEDPSAVADIGIELYLEAQVGRLTLRGIIDRLELDDDGGLVVTDYKTGRPPPGRGSCPSSRCERGARRCSGRLALWGRRLVRRVVRPRPGPGPRQRRGRPRVLHRVGARRHEHDLAPRGRHPRCSRSGPPG